MFSGRGFGCSGSPKLAWKLPEAPGSLKSSFEAFKLLFEASQAALEASLAWPALALAWPWPGPALAWSCPGLAWPALALAWPGLALAWLGLAWPGPALAWLSLAWLGQARATKMSLVRHLPHLGCIGVALESGQQGQNADFGSPRGGQQEGVKPETTRLMTPKGSADICHMIGCLD